MSPDPFLPGLFLPCSLPQLLFAAAEGGLEPSLLAERHSLSREDAYLLASDAADFSITQLVDGKRGVHAMISKSLFTGRSPVSPALPIPAHLNYFFTDFLGLLQAWSVMIRLYEPR